MILVLRMIKKVATPVKHGAQQMQSKLNSNHFITVSHVVLILPYTILSLLDFNLSGYLSIVTFVKVEIAWTFVGGVSDLFISCMSWFILDSKETPDVVRHGNWSYAVLNVTKPVSSAINYEN